MEKYLHYYSIQEEQLQMQISELKEDVQELLVEESMAVDSLQKADIRKKAAEKKKLLFRYESSLNRKTSKIRAEVAAETDAFNAQFDINPILLVNIVLKF